MSNIIPLIKFKITKRRGPYNEIEMSGLQPIMGGR